MRLVYLTASDAGEGDGYMLGRERGVRAAYAYMAHQPDEWTEDTAVAGGHTIARFTLKGNPRVQLWHMRLKDPWLGQGWGSLTPLSRVESEPGQTADTLGPHAERYTRPDLVDTLADLIRQYAPTTVRHLDDTINVPYTQLCWRCADTAIPTISPARGWCARPCCACPAITPRPAISITPARNAPATWTRPRSPASR